MKKLLTSLLIIISFTLKAQHHDSNEEHHKRFKFSWAMSQSFIPEFVSEDKTITAQFIPTNGLELEYAISKSIYLKWINEIEFLAYSVIDESGQEAKRENAFLTALLLGYKINPNIGIYGGFGHEFEKHRNLLVYRIGAEYIFDIGKDWALAPSIMYDIKKESHTAFTFSIVIGKHF